MNIEIQHDDDGEPFVRLRLIDHRMTPGKVALRGGRLHTTAVPEPICPADALRYADALRLLAEHAELLAFRRAP